MHATKMSDIKAPAGEADPLAIQQVFDSQLATSRQWRESTAAERIIRLKKLRVALMARREDFYRAFTAECGKPNAEVEATEFLPILDEIRHAIGCLKRWMRPTRVWPTLTTIGTYASIHYQPRGRCLVIAPWNFPLNLCFGPMVSALAAGNTVILKPSEMTPAVNAVMVQVVAATFAPHEVALFEGSLPTSQALLALPFDHIFFTGSSAVGKIVMSAAAKHLTSVTLELGGKSPVIVDETADLRLAAETLLWGKFTNCGQICVAPDHVFVHESVKARFVNECRRVLVERFGATPAQQRQSPDYGRIISQHHTRRLAQLLQEAQAKGANLLAGGEVDEATCYLSPTLIDQVPADAGLMQEEIFGPVLPVIGYTDIDQVVHDINAGPKPLALYLWSRDKVSTRRILQRTSSGGVAINHCVLQYAHGNLPFGGVNHSGIGNAHGYFGFKAFSHARAVLESGPVMVAKLFFPPFTNIKKKCIRLMVDSLRWPSVF